MIFIKKRKNTPAVFREAKNSYEDYGRAEYSS